YLIFKECIHNAVRHSACSRVDVELRIEKGSLKLTVRDDGQDIRESEAWGNGGHGLASMRRRAVDLGAELEVTSLHGQGVSSVLSVPLARRGAWSRLAARRQAPAETLCVV